MSEFKVMDIYEFLSEVSKTEIDYVKYFPNQYSKRNKKKIEYLRTEDSKISAHSVIRDKNIFIFLDTCVWINNADKGNFDFFVKLVDLHLQYDATLLVPEQLKIEWNRNKHEKLLENKLNAFDDMLRKTKKFRDTIVKDDEQKQQLDSLIRNAENFQIKQIEYVNQSTIILVEQILDLGVSIPTTDEIKVNAANMALQKQAPFHKNKNSMGDAVLFQSLLSYLENHQDAILYFITDNTKDFSENQNTPHEMHPELLSIVQEKNIELHYSLDLNRTLDEIIAVVTDEAYVNDYKEKYQKEQHENYQNRCPLDGCNGRMIMHEHRWDGQGNRLVYQCEDCLHKVEDGAYLEDYLS